jgi:uncharacterized protein (DUF1800 family)
MPDTNEITLMAHLMRRAGFGARRDELEDYASQGYEATVEKLLNVGDDSHLEKDIVDRYYIDIDDSRNADPINAWWLYRMINTPRQLQEKMALFWHGIFCTGHAKCENPRQQSLEIDMFRRNGMGRYEDLLLGLAYDPAMVFYLDNCMSHKGAINENWGRELLELFSMGVGKDGQLNYTEDDVKEAARAFTGWTVANAMPRYPYGRYLSTFVYDPKDHDDGQKTFLGETGNWNGEDIIRIIAKQPATARFIARHLYNYFVADEPQVPAWQHTPPRDPEAIKMLEDEYFRSGTDIRSMLRVLFNSDWFKQARFAKVKSPVETVVGTTRLVKDFDFPKPGFNALALNIRYMG